MAPRTLLTSLALTLVLNACHLETHRTHDHMHDAMTPSSTGDTGSPADVMAAMMADMTPEMQAMMAAWGEFMTVNPQHVALAATAGRWNLHVKHWMTPDTPMEESDGVAEFEAFAEGRYLIERVTSDSPMGPFMGMGITGFNNRTGRYFNVWFDNTGTGLMMSEGEGDPNARVIYYSGSFDDPMSGGLTQFRAERRVINANTFQFEMWMEMDGQEFKSMEITYTRM